MHAIDLKDLVRAALIGSVGLLAPGEAGAAWRGPPVPAVSDTPCGWYVVFMCSRAVREAQYWSDQREAISSFVIETGPATPNFAPGWFCAVDGPMSRPDALARAEEIRSWGSAPEAYAKNSCR
jgi:hypothetical protein